MSLDTNQPERRNGFETFARVVTAQTKGLFPDNRRQLALLKDEEVKIISFPSASEADTLCRVERLRPGPARNKQGYIPLDNLSRPTYRDLTFCTKGSIRLSHDDANSILIPTNEVTDGVFPIFRSLLTDELSTQSQRALDDILILDPSETIHLSTNTPLDEPSVQRMHAEWSTKTHIIAVISGAERLLQVAETTQGEEAVGAKTNTTEAARDAQPADAQPADAQPADAQHGKEVEDDLMKEMIQDMKTNGKPGTQWDTIRDEIQSHGDVFLENLAGFIQKGSKNACLITDRELLKHSYTV